MSEYTPDRWVMLEFTGKDGEPLRKIFAGWYGGFTQGDSWRLNSGVTDIRIDNKVNYEFDGYSGSTYYCHADDYGMSGYMAQVLASVREKMPLANIKEIELEQIESL
jgi:hypothetical protein